MTKNNLQTDINHKKSLLINLNRLYIKVLYKIISIYPVSKRNLSLCVSNDQRAILDDFCVALTNIREHNHNDFQTISIPVLSNTHQKKEACQKDVLRCSMEN
jgi:hypothetical protein